MNWLEALRQTALEYESAPVVWGQTDCCQFANAYYERVTGRSPADSFRYDSELGAQRILAKHGDIEGLLEAILGEPVSDPQPGDIVASCVSDDGDLTAAGVFNGYCVWTIDPDKGLVRITANRISKAWRVV